MPRENWPKECSSVIDTGFNGWGWRSCARMRKYLEYVKSFYPKAALGETKERLLRFALGRRQGRDSTMVESLHIWVIATFKPAREVNTM